MKAYDILRQYMWLIETIHEYGPITLVQINQRWKNSHHYTGNEISRATFIRYKRAISDIFSIEIECNSNDYSYYIANPHILRGNTLQRWMLNSITVSNIIGESLSLQDRIILEDIPIEGKTLKTIVDAMKSRRYITFTYQKYGDSEAKERLIAPYCIKLFHQRWYVIGCDQHLQELPLRVFAFDRIQNLQMTGATFILPKDFHAETLFKECLGVILGDGKNAQSITIRAYGKERFYLRDLPLHPSQEIVAQGEDYADYKYYLRPSHDFISALLSKGGNVEVLSPDSLRGEIKKIHCEALKNYK